MAKSKVSSKDTPRQEPIKHFDTGVVTVKELMEKIDLTEKECVYLETFLIHEDRSAGGIAVEVAKKGGNVSKILRACPSSIKSGRFF